MLFPAPSRLRRSASALEAHVGGGRPGYHGECFTKQGNPRTHVDPTIAHMDHMHLGLTKPGAAAQTTSWRAAKR
jgi:hypothetical protein